MMIDLGSQRSGGPLYIMESAATSVDCSGQIPLRRSLRSLVHRLVPACCSATPVSDDSPTTTTTSTVTGTFFGLRKGRVSFCLQDSSHDLLLVELAVPTAFLAREMQHGILRIALECDGRSHRSCPLFSVPVWSLYCNGRRVGFAVRRKLRERDVAVLKIMQSVSVGAGVLPVPGGDLMYLRATFERVSGSAHSESFHMMNPGGSSGQELSIFFFRSS